MAHTYARKQKEKSESIHLNGKIEYFDLFFKISVFGSFSPQKGNKIGENYKILIFLQVVCLVIHL